MLAKRGNHSNKKLNTQFFSKSYEIVGDSFTKLFKEIKEKNIPVCNMREKDGILKLNLKFGNDKVFRKICSDNGYDVKITRNGDVLKACSFILHRPALIIGLILVFISIIFLKNIVLRFDIMCDDEKIKSGIMNVLNEEGVTVGSYIPDINLVVTERALKQKVEGICWAGITRKGNSLIIDVVKTIPKTTGYYRRLPSNIIATENAVIDDIDVLDGQVKYGVGCGVCKGDIIVSGEVVKTKSKWIDGKENILVSTRYARSLGTINGTFERTMVFEQPLENTEKVLTGEVKKQNYFHLFSADIPLFFSSEKGNYKTDCTLECPKIFGVTMPFGIKSQTLTEYDFKPVLYSQEQAFAVANEKAYRYEQNFLEDYSIKDRQVKRESDEECVRLTVTYRLYGEIGKEVAFFIKK